MRIINLNVEQKGSGVPEGSVYIGRTHTQRGLQQSIFANPFPLKNPHDDNERQEVLEKYSDWLWEQLQSKRILIEDLKALDGHDLACFCFPKQCHGMVVKKAVEWSVGKDDSMDFTEDSIPWSVKKTKTLKEMLRYGR